MWGRLLFRHSSRHMKDVSGLQRRVQTCRFRVIAIQIYFMPWVKMMSVSECIEKEDPRLNFGIF